jgi:hypothetical protein
MWVASQWFSPEVIGRIRATVEQEPTLSRRALSRQVCQWMDWRDDLGRPREVGCRKALLELQRRGVIKLPVCQEVENFGAKAAKPPAVPEVAVVQCSLAELGDVRVVPVSSRYSKASAQWRGMLEAYHYLGSGPLCGAQIRYLIESPSFGLLGAMSFSAATRRLKSRDEFIEWSESARLSNLQYVVCNSRFLIVPSVEVPHLASHVLSISLRRLRDDWQQKYGYAPVLVETFVDGSRFDGTCYRAANWKWLGQTAGRTEGYRNGTLSTGKKEVFIYRLYRHWKRILCQEPQDRLVLRNGRGEAEDWVEEEFAGARIYDERLRQRLYTMTRDFFSQPGALIPEACEGSQAKTKAAYRFLDNERVGMEPLLRGHVEATAARMREQEVVLAVQDTATLNYMAHPATKGLGPINTKGDRGVGLILHDTLAFTPDGTPLGLLDVQCWARRQEEAGKTARRKQLPIEQKESFKWLRSYRATAEVQQLCPQTMVVSVGDREADIHELFWEAQKTEGGPQLLVRSERGRNRKVLTENEQAFLWEKMPSVELAGSMEAHLPRRGSRPARIATLEVRYAPVTLKPPQRKREPQPPVQAWAVYALERNPPPEATSAVEWMLLTTVEVSSFEQALERLDWYGCRWNIEIYHRVLKSGCRIEDRQLNDAEKIESCLAIDLVVGWRIFWLVKQGRETPELPCTVFFNDDEWRVLYSATYRQRPPATPPTLGDAMRMTAKLGGFLGRNGDGYPGPTTLWRGLTKLLIMVEGYRLALSEQPCGDGP